MSKIISVHSFRGGTGKSNISANLAVALSICGKNTGIVDTDIQSPGVHIPFGFTNNDIKYTLNDFLWGKCDIINAAYRINLNNPLMIGELFLIPSSIKASDIARVLHYGYDVELLREGFKSLIKELNLDFLIIDTHPGLNEETLLSIAISDVLIVIMRPDSQDYQGTAVTIEVARHLEVAGIEIIVNKVPASYSCNDVIAKVKSAYDCNVLGLIPHSEELMSLASSGIFILQNENHSISQTIFGISRKLISL